MTDEEDARWEQFKLLKKRHEELMKSWKFRKRGSGVGL